MGAFGSVTCASGCYVSGGGGCAERPEGGHGGQRTSSRAPGLG